ncbi:hypothetical protein QQX98_008413 [Neonectria punicea]|uniref:Mannose-1-phosphate guanylyltransferase n=1 Tax=Neonectria punicea TaxID=979145 RepID=A0ABR1GVM9_9HYPO
MRQEFTPQAMSGLLKELYDLPLAGVKQSHQFQTLQTSRLDKTRLLASIPNTPEPSVRPLHLLYLLLTEISVKWPTFELFKCHTRLVTFLPEEAKVRSDGDSAWLVEATSELVKKSYKSVLQFKASIVPHPISDYHLLDVGNDVVFGSHAYLVTSDGLGSENIAIRDRAMIADRKYLLPDVKVGERVTLGSGALTQRGKKYSPGEPYVGSKAGDAVCLSTGRAMQEKGNTRSGIHHMSSDDTLTGSGRDTKKSLGRIQTSHMTSDDTLANARNSSKKDKCQVLAVPVMAADGGTNYDSDDSSTRNVSPFGRAFYLKLAPYRVLGPFAIFCYSSFSHCLHRVLLERSRHHVDSVRRLHCEALSAPGDQRLV